MKPGLPSTPLSIGGVLDSAFKLFSSSYSRCWLLALLGSLVTAAVSILYVQNAANLMTQIEQPAADPALQLSRLFAQLSSLYTPSMLGASLLAGLVSGVFYGAVVLTQNAWSRGEELSLGGALGASLGRLPAAFVLGIVTGIIIGVGCVLLLIPGIYFAGKLQLAWTAVYVDKAGPFEALGTSWRLTRGRWWRGIVIVTVAFIVLYVLSMAFSFGGALVGNLAAQDAATRLIIVQVFMVAARLLVLPFTVAIWLAMYNDFKLRREGGDLAARASALGKA
jgi:hypothetical protein